VIAVDVFERRSGIPATLERLGAAVEIRALPVGDYVVGASIIERKRVSDLHKTVISGRFWAQIGALREAARYPFLLVEGDDLSRGPIQPTAIRAICIATIRLGIRLLRSRDESDSALWIYQLAVDERRRRRYRPSYAQRPKSRRWEQSGLGMLTAIPGISANTAGALLQRFGSVVGVFSASENELLSVPGVGPARAAAIHRAVSTPYS
jgi:ERCC4-type nuclease